VASACAVYLFTSQSLLHSRNSEVEQVLRVVKGFHGLHVYAHEFLVKHTARYAELQYQCSAPLSETLIALLARLLCLRKKDMPINFLSASRELKSLSDIEQRLTQTNLPSSLRSFMRDVLVFQEISNQDNHHHTDPKSTCSYFYSSQYRLLIFPRYPTNSDSE
jgi:hypothetical protein